MAIITVELLTDFANKFAAKISQKFAKKTDIPSIPVDAKFTDTVYTHPTSAGNKHIPAGGASGQILRWSAAGTAEWGADTNTTYSEATTSKAGLISAADKTKLDGMTEATTADIDSIIAGTFT